ncbi:nuclear transport factor 2 family protein [Mesorhizobium sp. M1C.F.Ca.ET.193.01.1.1]|uniref:nuclear transport factor 2 family protein n=1 Tax=unclassified Mesorhizobium TaxID=325217 RepID=UPI000FD1FE64|nr:MULTISPECIES: nuclear transport factor 2 family protein [unclassified Mesorhizobium]TGS92236.1 nuclear transport factor 2 family protein [bacterium M00.F.Ca.ET.177.01.1.1]RWA62865.1 MAG: nuclear transport factor 2 family protein [Mesorhizobium sp.]RWB94852.1 MAG: nuclear transport factor 2 family protein [Mesorhizobium sp.]RWG82222.1 MAG: nuclear transport factor 2 family protein [Mesorhizobium sp.]RWG86901.1 MAG: nuclear transport factor 2 family protein [Mesorhizobium sp.]
MDRIWWKFLLAAALLLSAIVHASADDSAIIDRWYSALLVADRTELSDLLADDVRMKLDDVGVVQDKQEFLESIDEWQGAVAGATIRHRIEKSENGETTVLACYDFPENDTLMRETFTVVGGRITASTQTAIAQDCSDY